MTAGTPQAHPRPTLDYAGSDRQACARPCCVALHTYANTRTDTCGLRLTMLPEPTACSAGWQPGCDSTPYTPGCHLGCGDGRLYPTPTASRWLLLCPGWLSPPPSASGPRGMSCFCVMPKQHASMPLCSGWLQFTGVYSNQQPSPPPPPAHTHTCTHFTPFTPVHLACCT
jgi:hypothetical protein